MATPENAQQEIAQTVDEVLNVRKIKRRVWRWRIVALVLFVFVIGGVISQIGPPSGPHIARYAVNGVIVEDAERDAMLDEIAENDDIKALIVDITSPGGSVSGSEDLYNALRRVAERKPVVASMGTVAASGGYITALGADYVFARRNSMTGSIGVIFQVTRFGDLMEELGVSVDTYESGPLKSQPSPFKPISDEGKQVVDALIMDSYVWFRDMVAERRNIPVADLENIADGRVFTGKQALDAGLVDALGGPHEVRNYLTTQYGIAEDVDTYQYELAPEDGPFATSSRLLGSLIGLKPLETKRLFVDGLAAIWHPSLI